MSFGASTSLFFLPTVGSKSSVQRYFQSICLLGQKQQIAQAQHSSEFFTVNPHTTASASPPPTTPHRSFPLRHRVTREVASQPHRPPVPSAARLHRSLRRPSLPLPRRAERAYHQLPCSLFASLACQD